MAELYQSECYCTNARRSANVLTELYDSALKAQGLTVAQYYLLINLSRLERANITVWAERVGLERSTMVRNIKVLEDHGLVTRTEGHGKVFTLSERGREVLEAAIPVWNDVQRKIESLLGKEDTEAILRIGGKLQSLRAMV